MVNLIFHVILFIWNLNIAPCNGLTGTASVYANHFNNKKTATGEIYKSTNMTAASNNFKLNTFVIVTNLHNNKKIIVKINDRMAKSMSKKGRIIDLSPAANKKLGINYVGLTKVCVEEIVPLP